MTTRAAPDESCPPLDGVADAVLPADLSAFSDAIVVAQQRILQSDIAQDERAELSRELRRAVAVGRRDPRRELVLIDRLVSRAAAPEAAGG